MTFKVTSNSFKDGDYLALDHILSQDFGFGCAGGNKSPHLSWSGAPEGTKSFAVTCYDPDAPTGSGFLPMPGFCPETAAKCQVASSFLTMVFVGLSGLFDSTQSLTPFRVRASSNSGIPS